MASPSTCVVHGVLQVRAHANRDPRFSRSGAVRYRVDQGFGLDDDVIGGRAFDDFLQLGTQADKARAIAVDVELKRTAATDPVSHEKMRQRRVLARTWDVRLNRTSHTNCIDLA